ncbi:MAG: tetratricopeptide repeat protein, partial [Candidatus Heimdallarchaeota archaeon]
IIPIEYQSIFNIIPPLQKSGILKIIKTDFTDIKDNYDKYLLCLQKYLEKYKGEDISSIVFIMFSQIATDLQKDALIIKMLEFYPDSPELKYYKILQDVDKGVFDGIDEVLKIIRLNDAERNTILTRLVAADKLAKIILDLQSFSLEMMFYSLKHEFQKVPEIYEKVEPIWKRVLKWVQEKEIIYVIELGSRIITQQTQYLMTAKNLDAAIAYFEKPENQEVLNMCKSSVMKANVLHVAAMLYYQAGQPKKAIKRLETAIKLHKKVHSRNSWKSTFYHNLAYMHSLTDTEKCLEAYHKGLELLEDTEDLQSIASTLSNIIGLYQQANKKAEARKYLMQLVEILESSEDLVTAFRAYAVASNALSLDEYKLSKKYLTKLEEKVGEQPTNFNKAILAGAKMVFNLEAQINSEEAYMWGEECLYYFNKQKDYLNALGSLFNLTGTDLDFYKITGKERYLKSARKRFNELFTLIGALELPEFIAAKNITLAGYELLNKNFDKVASLLESIPEVKSDSIRQNKEIMEQLLEFSKKRMEVEDGSEPITVSSEPIMNELANNKDAQQAFIMHILEKTLQELVSLPQQVDPIKADIKLMLLINSAGLTIYTKVLDVQKMNQQLISNFISAIDSFGKQLFGTTESYFSISRGNNIILFQKVNEDLDLAFIVSQENYDSIMKLTTLSKEIKDHLNKNKIELNKVLNETDSFYKWLQKEIDELIQ